MFASVADRRAAGPETFSRAVWIGLVSVAMKTIRAAIAGVLVDAVRCAKLGLDRGLGGPLEAVSAC